MAVAHDAVSNSGNGTGNLSWTHTPSGTPKGALVFVATRSLADQVTSVTYGGQAMTQVTDSPVVSIAGSEISVHGFFLGSGVPTGAQTVSVTVSGSTTKRGVAITVTASNNTEVHDTNVFQSGGAGGPSVALTISKDSALYGMLMSGVQLASGVGPGANMTELDEAAVPNRMVSTIRKTTNASSNDSVAWTANFNEQTALGVAIAETSGSAHSQPVNDSVAGTDARAKTIKPAKADSLSGTDAQARVWAASRIQADSASVTDATAKAGSNAVADNASATDATATGAGKGQTDSASATDQIARGWDAERTVEDSASVTDAATRDVAVSLADGFSLDDTLAAEWEAGLALADSVSTTDAVAKDATASASDSVSATDAIDAAIILLVELDDSVSVTDARTSEWEASRTIADTFAGTDANTKDAGKAQADSIAGTDATAKASGLPLADSAAITDAAAVSWAALLGLADSASVTDSTQVSGGARAWTYANTDTASYGGTTDFTYANTDDWNYEPVTG